MNTQREKLEKALTVNSQQGLHARIATLLVQAMQKFSCEVTVVKDGVEVNARSVLGLLLLAATSGTQILVRAQGPDSTEAIEEFSRLIEHEDTKRI
ncbi:MAG: HPr family phosphocarrier protein [Pseudomonadota bacterium]